MQIERLADGWSLIDLEFIGHKQIIGSYVCYDGHEAMIIETGPSTCVSTLTAALSELQIPLDKVSHVVATHIHLDHSGACGVLAREMPKAKVYVHPFGAQHLIDPSKLIASAGRIYGDLMDFLWGEIAPVPEGRVVIVQDGDEIAGAGRRLRAIETPGHARHHHAYLDLGNRSLFAGDIAGVRLPGFAYVRPPTPPPELNLEDWDASLAKIRAIGPSFLNLTHFGQFQDVDRHLADLQKRLHDWGALVKSLMSETEDEEAIVERVRQAVHGEMQELGIDPEEYDVAASYQMGVQGYIRYWRRKLMS